QSDAASSFHLYDQRTSAVAFHRDARFGGEGGEEALQDAVILGVVLAAEAHEWFGSYLFQRDGFQPSEGMRSGQRHAPGIGAQQFKVDACSLLVGGLDHDREFERSVLQSG